MSCIYKQTMGKRLHRRTVRRILRPFRWRRRALRRGGRQQRQSMLCAMTVHVDIGLLLNPTPFPIPVLCWPPWRVSFSLPRSLEGFCEPPVRLFFATPPAASLLNLYCIHYPGCILPLFWLPLRQLLTHPHHVHNPRCILAFFSLPPGHLLIASLA